MTTFGFLVLALYLLVEQGCCFATKTVPVPHLSSEQCRSGGHELRYAVTNGVVEIIGNL